MTDTVALKEWIDKASYESLLKRWRFGESRDPMFHGEVGEYYKKVMGEKRDALPNDERVAASKNVGWDK
jgi:hypothetical protein